MKRYLILLIAFFGYLPFACNTSCGDAGVYKVKPDKVSFKYEGTWVPNSTQGEDTVHLEMNSELMIQALLSGEHVYTVSLAKPFWDGGVLLARDPCPPPTNDGFNPGIDSFVLRADKAIGSVPAGESLNALFTCEYSNEARRIPETAMLNLLNQGIQEGSINLDDYADWDDYRLNLKPYNISFYGSYVFTLEVYLKDQTMISGSSLVVLLK